MSERSSGKSHALAWTLSILVVPVLYLLSVPPLGAVLPAVTLGGKGPPRYQVYALQYREPWVWLADQTRDTFVGDAMRSYDRWCWTVIRG
jgi:hypothetical protein